MILPTMTLTELAKEIQSDYKEVHARWTKFNPKFNKMRLKQTYYPWIWNTEIITKKNNKWFFSFYAQSTLLLGMEELHGQLIRLKEQMCY